MTQKWLRWLAAPFLALGLLVLLPTASFAGSPTASAPQHETLHQWRAKRHAIEVTFRQSVTRARQALHAASGGRTTAANRFAARTAFEAAIAQAAAARATALIALGPNPTKSSDGVDHHPANPRRGDITPPHVRIWAP